MHRLLFHCVRPVFVFDGATPAIKRRTVIARRQLREQAGAKLRKTAEKLLLSRLKCVQLFLPTTDPKVPVGVP